MRKTTLLLVSMLLLTTAVALTPAASAKYCGTGGLQGSFFDIAERTASNCIDHAEQIYCVVTTGQDCPDVG